MSEAKLARQFRPRVDEARRARIWKAIDGRLDRVERRRPFRKVALAFGLSGVMAAIVAVSVFGGISHAPAQRMHLIELADGSRVTHAPEDRVEIEVVTPELVELRMISGSAQFMVTPNGRRAFLTHVAGFTVRVVGTEYAVDLTPEQLRVTVRRGQVDVTRDAGGEVVHIRAGESWSVDLRKASAVSSSAPSASVEAPASPPSGVASVADTPQLAPSEARAPKEGASTAAKRAEAAALFQRAQEARLAGKEDQAARLLQEFLRRFPNDPRAGLAAFELGRLRLDARDSKGAMEAFDQAEGAGKAFEEQVAARRVQALEQSGDMAGCRAERDAFLRKFPRGTFTAVVRSRCSSK